MTHFVSKARPMPTDCPQGCGAQILHRSAGPWCPRCRGWVIEHRDPGEGQTKLVVMSMHR